MPKLKIAVFSGPQSTVANSPTLVTSNKARLSTDRKLEGRFDHLVSQSLYEPVKVKIKKYSAHPLEEDAKSVYHDDGKPYYEVELRPEDGLYLLPYVARRKDGSSNGVPFEESDLNNPALGFGARQFFYPDASRIFEEIDRTIHGRDEHGEADILDRKATFDFIRAIPPGGYTSKGEKLGVDYFPYKPPALARTPPASMLARAASIVNATLKNGDYDGGVWLEGSPTIEETLFWLGLLVPSAIPLVGVAAQRAHGQISNDGDRNIIDAVNYIVSGEGKGLGAVGIVDEQIFAAREFKKSDDRPGGYKATGGHGGVLGSMGPPVTIWYKPNYRHTTTSMVNIDNLPGMLSFSDFSGDARQVTVKIKNEDGSLAPDSIPSVAIAKYGHYSARDSKGSADSEVDILARISTALSEQSAGAGSGVNQLHGLVFEGLAPYGIGAGNQIAAMDIAACSGLPVVRVGRGDPGGRVPKNQIGLTMDGNNLDATKARLLLMAAMMKLGRLPKAQDPRNATQHERDAIKAKVQQFQEIFDAH
ncbi:MAG: hypothetical protein EXR59_02805 [Dehalococcoidia bacterium]|nr:hypothetical protein [Dehalococcoidia bacterium]